MFSIKETIKKTPLYSLILIWKNRKIKAREIAIKNEIIRIWKLNGKPLPPPQCFKRDVIKEYAKKNGISIFIETGTYIGETLESFKNSFKKLISIELDEQLFKNAKQKFVNDKNIELYQGDSGEVIERVIDKMNEPCLFWLDGHYSEGITAKGQLNTPILAELNHILNHSIKDHVILIDDARCFNGLDDYPTIDELKKIIVDKKPALQFSVADDIIRIHK